MTPFGKIKIHDDVANLHKVITENVKKITGEQLDEINDFFDYAGKLYNGNLDEPITAEQIRKFHDEQSGKNKPSDTAETTINFGDGKKWVGQTKNDQPHGKGIMRFINGEKYEGFWNGKGKDNYVGAGIHFFADGSQEIRSYNEFYSKYVTTELSQGMTKVFRVDGLYVGQLKDGKRHGIGTQYSNKDASRYEGEWVLDEKHGKGVFHFPDGRTEPQQFEYGKWVKYKK